MPADSPPERSAANQLFDLLEVVCPCTPGWSAQRRWDRIDLRLRFHARYGV
jgi:hypothetical protein